MFGAYALKDSENWALERAGVWARLLHLTDFRTRSAVVRLLALVFAELLLLLIILLGSVQGLPVF